MTEPVSGDLLSPTDFGRFKSKEEEWFLGAAGDVVRNECGWHVFPERPETNIVAAIGNSGIVMLPTLNLVSVQRVSFHGVELPSESYESNPAGFLTLLGHYLPGQGAIGPYTGTQGLFRRSGTRFVTVDFTHGFSTCPRPVAEVGYELTARTLEKPAGVAKSLQAGPNAFTFNEFGMVLTDDQRRRLGPYSIMEIS